MGFAWPLALLGLLAPIALVAAYVWISRRRRRSVVRHSNVALVRAAAPRMPGWKRHLPVALVVAALTVMVAAAARPRVEATVSQSGSAVILALDVSGSMCSTDVDPNRLTAAQNAVRTFVGAQDSSTKIGLVIFSGFAQVAVAPTTDRQPLVNAINAVTTGRGTTIGAAILSSINAISQIDPNVKPADTTPAPSPPASGHYAPEIVVLLTDGANTRGVTPQEAATQAAARGVRVYPIGFGTTNPAPMVCSADQLGGDMFQGFGGGGFGGRMSQYLIADEPTLKQVAATTGGAYYKATDAGQLQGVLKDLPNNVDRVTRPVEISAGLVALGIVLLIGGVAAAARWSAFPV
ncbi:MAG: VWA domain-containing protein [Nostocoides sp.]